MPNSIPATVNELFLPGAFVLTALAVIWDLARRRIPNHLTLTAIAAGLAGHALASGLGGLAWSGVGLAVGLGLLLLPFLSGGMGAGDVKLMAALGAIVGARSVFEIALLSAVVGGALAFATALRDGKAREALARAFALCMPWRRAVSGTSLKTGELGSIPYGAAIAMGTWIWMLSGGIL